MSAGGGAIEACAEKGWLSGRRKILDYTSEVDMAKAIVRRHIHHTPLLAGPERCSGSPTKDRDAVPSKTRCTLRALKRDETTITNHVHHLQV
jgi:hypothetical protein